MFGFSEQDLIGQSIDKLMPAPHKYEHENYLRQYLDTGIAKIIGIGRELLAQNSQGEVFPIHLTTTEVQARGSKIFVGVIRNLSQDDDTEQLLLEQRAQLAHAGRLITMGELTASIAHEVNQPLAAIEMYAKTCQRLLGKESFDRELVHSTLQKLSDQTLRVGEVITGIQRFVKSSDGARSLVNVNAALAEIQHLIAGDALSRGIELVYDLTPNRTQVRCDARQIQQVALNLLRNAIEAMDEVDCCNGAQIILSTQLKDGFVSVAVDDTGAGVPSTQEQHMFVAFHSTKLQGIGLGLSICKSIIEDHGGEIGYSNKEAGQGCIFYFTLPIDKQVNEKTVSGRQHE